MQKKLKNLFGDSHGLDEKSVDFLTNALNKSNLPGFDYLEFKQSLAALMEMDMEEGIAIKSAFATAATMGLTKEKLLKTAIHYKKVLQEEKKQFDAALQKQMKQRVDSKLAEVEKLKKQIEDYKLKIKQLEEKIAASQSTVDSADEIIQADKERIVATGNNFDHTLQSIVNQIEQDMENIEKFL